MTEQQLDDWVSRLADEVIEDARKRDTKVVCASGISPSGPIHLGNLREVMTPHLVADEVRRRGIECEHLISWDDYDRFRKVPNGIAGVDSSWAEHIGKPLTAVPAPPGSTSESWAAHFREQCERSLAQLGVTYRSISQTDQYTAGAYVDQILFAMEHRDQIDKVLDQYRTLPAADQQQPKGQQKLDEDQAAAAAEAAEGSGAASEDDGSAGKEYYPYKPFCTVCNKDFTTVTAYDPETTQLSYDCGACGHTETVELRTFNHGKLVWKVDWPMRWAYEKVLFEPSGVDHQSPGSSYVVGKELAPLFGWERPIGPMYAFVGIKGMAKMSSSKGGVPVAEDALQIMEPALLRWLYARRKPNQAFDVAFDAEIQRMYDEWDALSRKVADGKGQAGDIASYTRASSTAAGELPSTPYPVAYRTLASIVDITTGDEDQTLRIVGQLDPDNPPASLDTLRPRLTCVEHWVATRMADEDKTIVREIPDAAGLAAADQDALRMLVDGNGADLAKIEDVWTLDGLTHQIYGVPKVMQGKSADFRPDRKAEPELAASLGAAQREFFKQVYNLLIGKDTGPRLPTLLLAVGPEKVRELLTPAG
ncbi:lysine--tRNA ligase [Yimella sp. cx-51]|uniref:lysine--tRNA ligase n=1 Tax=Yimella sp. cx-51 TaxID=2770551 RepID=UPI00165E841B|nr:lysine--tRNA ligase [Yimella sp. cx-51]MBC9955729.1 lysine--tRNA ligase [Yimella sp. cx-51]QTH37705.1 lysine--tRNA ligase [Yimella sp. cx-51]